MEIEKVTRVVVFLSPTMLNETDAIDDNGKLYMRISNMTDASLERARRFARLYEATSEKGKKHET